MSYRKYGKMLLTLFVIPLHIPDRFLLCLWGFHYTWCDISTVKCLPDIDYLYIWERDSTAWASIEAFLYDEFLMRYIFLPTSAIVIDWIFLSSPWQYRRKNALISKCQGILLISVWIYCMPQDSLMLLLKMMMWVVGWEIGNTIDGRKFHLKLRENAPTIILPLPTHIFLLLACSPKVSLHILFVFIDCFLFFIARQKPSSAMEFARNTSK